MKNYIRNVIIASSLFFLVSGSILAMETLREKSTNNSDLTIEQEQPSNQQLFIEIQKLKQEQLKQEQLKLAQDLAKLKVAFEKALTKEKKEGILKKAGGFLCSKILIAPALVFVVLSAAAYIAPPTSVYVKSRVDNHIIVPMEKLYAQVNAWWKKSGVIAEKQEQCFKDFNKAFISTDEANTICADPKNLNDPTFMGRLGVYADRVSTCGKNAAMLNMNKGDIKQTCTPSGLIPPTTQNPKQLDSSPLLLVIEELNKAILRKQTCVADYQELRINPLNSRFGNGEKPKDCNTISEYDLGLLNDQVERAKKCRDNIKSLGIEKLDDIGIKQECNTIDNDNAVKLQQNTENVLDCRKITKEVGLDPVAKCPAKMSTEDLQSVRADVAFQKYKNDVEIRGKSSFLGDIINGPIPGHGETTFNRFYNGAADIISKVSSAITTYVLIAYGIKKAQNDVLKAK
jgi:hypothetical protein